MATLAPGVTLVFPEGQKCEGLREYGLLKLFQERHQVLVEELGAKTHATYFTKVAKTQWITWY
jgi:hypothetical protein